MRAVPGQINRVFVGITRLFGFLSLPGRINKVCDLLLLLSYSDLSEKWVMVVVCKVQALKWTGCWGFLGFFNLSLVSLISYMALLQIISFIMMLCREEETQNRISFLHHRWRQQLWLGQHGKQEADGREAHADGFKLPCSWTGGFYCRSCQGAQRSWHVRGDHENGGENWAEHWSVHWQKMSQNKS